MKTKICAVCTSPNCGQVWAARSIIDIGPGSAILLLGCKTKACPRCRGIGSILGGRYMYTTSKLFNARDTKLIRYVLEETKWRFKDKDSTRLNGVRLELTGAYPFLSRIFSFFDQHFAERQLYNAILITIFDRYAEFANKRGKAEFHVTSEIYEMLENMAADIKTQQLAAQQRERAPAATAKEDGDSLADAGVAAWAVGEMAAKVATEVATDASAKDAGEAVDGGLSAGAVDMASRDTASPDDQCTDAVNDLSFIDSLEREDSPELVNSPELSDTNVDDPRKEEVLEESAVVDAPLPAVDPDCEEKLSSQGTASQETPLQKAPSQATPSQATPPKETTSKQTAAREKRHLPEEEGVD